MNREFYKEILENLYDGIYFVDRNRVILYWNRGAERITGYNRDQVIGRSCSQNILNHMDAKGRQLCNDGCPLAATMEDGVPREVDVFLHHADGHRLPVLVRVTPIRDEHGEILGAVEIFSSDLSVQTVRHELKGLRESLQTDTLTGIGNRRLIDGRLRAAIAELQNSDATRTGLLFFDIDHFKNVNDSYGHETGDRVLRMVATTLQNSLRRTDVVGRWGGEEFAAILYDIVSSEALSDVAEKARMLVEYSHLDHEGASLSVTVSIGATLFRSDDTPETVMERADGLMYRSKKAGRNRVSTG